MIDKKTNFGETSATRQGAGAESVAGHAFPWLLRRKIAVPDRVAGYVHRAELVSRAMPTGRRLTVLNASGGFGKTTLLAECCRRLRQNGVPTAWVSLDEQDEPAVLDIYIAFACHSAGLDLLNVSDPEVTNVGPESRVGLVVREIQKTGRPFVIAFDELERLRDPASVSLLEFLLKRGSSNLHLAIACRQIPDGLNVTGAVLESGMEVLTTEDLRFSKSEVARFFDLSLSRSELATAMDRSAGWPFALQIFRNQMERGTEADTRIVQDFVKNWVESRLFVDLTSDDRDLLLDIGLFDWMDAALLDEVLQRRDSMRRLDSLRVLVGLLEPVGGGATKSWRLYPLVRGHCTERRFPPRPWAHSIFWEVVRSVRWSTVIGLLLWMPSLCHLESSHGHRLTASLLTPSGASPSPLSVKQDDQSRFFDLSLSRSELATAMDRSAGWPFALQIFRNQMERGTEADTRIVQDFVKNWVESRLFVDLTSDDRDLLLDIGLFDWMDAALLDEVLQRRDSMRRLDSLRVLVGLLEPVGGGATKSWRLYPLVRGHCTERRFLENPQRFRAIHRRIAEALMRRGDTVSVMRHAIEGRDPVLAGHILERAGGVRLWIRAGLVPIRAADRYLNEDIISTRPRLALVRCLVLLMSGRFDDAWKLFREVATTSPAGTKDERDADFEYLVDECIVRGAIALYGAEPVDSIWVRTLSSDYVRLVESQRLDPVTHDHMEYALCVLHQLKAEFDAALERLAGARQFLAQSQYMTMYGEMLRGQVAMAQGHVQDAESHYRTAQRIARKTYVLDPVSPTVAEVMFQELALECSRVSSAAELRGVPKALMTNGVPFSAFAAASGLVIELKLRAGRIDQALTAADELLAYVRGAGLTSLARYLAVLRISVLVVAGRVRDAERAWRLENLPKDSEGCVDLTGQGWREMEAVACARLRCLIASERFDEGRGLARELRSVAGERRLRRTLMRALALSIVLEQRAGELESAVGHLEEYLSLFAESPYAWPLVRERAICEPVVTMFLDQSPNSPYQESARSLLAAIRRVDDVRDLVLSERERTVLLRLAGQRDKLDCRRAWAHRVRFALSHAQALHQAGCGHAGRRRTSCQGIGLDPARFLNCAHPRGEPGFDIPLRCSIAASRCRGSRRLSATLASGCSFRRCNPVVRIELSPTTRIYTIFRLRLLRVFGTFCRMPSAAKERVHEFGVTERSVTRCRVPARPRSGSVCAVGAADLAHLAAGQTGIRRRRAGFHSDHQSFGSGRNGADPRHRRFRPALRSRDARNGDQGKQALQLRRSGIGQRGQGPVRRSR